MKIFWYEGFDQKCLFQTNGYIKARKAEIIIEKMTIP